MQSLPVNNCNCGSLTIPRATSPTLHLLVMSLWTFSFTIKKPSRVTPSLRRGVPTSLAVCIVFISLQHSPAHSSWNLPKSDQMSRFGGLIIILLLHTWLWRRSHPMSILSLPKSHTVVIVWAKLASFVTIEGDTDAYTQLWCLGPAWLGLQVFWHFFPRNRFLLLPFYFFLNGRLWKRWPNSTGTYWVSWLSVMG